MPNTEDVIRGTRKLLPMFYLIDTSGSMSGEKIGSVNDAMRDLRSLLDEVEKTNADAEIKLAAMTFSSGASWVDCSKGGLVSPSDFYWTEVTAAGLTEVGEALKLLDKSLSRSSFLRSDVGYNMPVIIIMSDGAPTDEWEGTLNKVRNENSWFKYATKIAIAIGDADLDTLAKIVGNREAVIRVEDTETLAKLIRAVSVTASKIGSKSRGSNDSDSQQTATQIVQDTAADMGDDNGFDVPFADPTDASSDDGFDDSGF